MVVSVINIPVSLVEGKHRETYQIRENELEMLLPWIPDHLAPLDPLFEAALPIAWGRDWV